MTSPIEGQRAFIHQQDYSLHRRGSQDQQRHDEKVRDAIKGDIEKIITDGSIITADPQSKRIVKIPLRSMELPHIRHKQGDDGIGTGEGGVGDVIGHIPGDGSGKGKGAGQGRGAEYYEAEFTVEEIQKMVFADLGLPYVQPKPTQEMETDTTVFEDRRKKRTPTNLDVQATIFENMKRNATERGRVEIAGISPDDYRVKTWRKEVRHDNAAVVIAMADISGSMGDTERYLTRSFMWWGTHFLKANYPKVHNAFIVHDTEAEEVDEQAFFERGSGGGTTCSSAYRKVSEIILNQYPPELYNIYLLHFSDGDNWGSDDKTCVELGNDMLARGISQMAYVQVGRQGESGLFRAFRDGLQNERYNGLVIAGKPDIWPGLKKVFDPSKQIAA